MSKYKQAAFLLFIGLLVYFPVFLHLTNLSVRVWDESRLAVNAYDMAHSGDWLVTPYEGAPDMWNTKPPLMIWLQVICIKIFGANEFSIRFPAAMAAIFTCALIFAFCDRFIKSRYMALCATLLLITSGGYIVQHVTRTGDFDSLLVLFTTASLLFFFIYTETEGKQSGRFLLYFFIATTLAVLCKGVTGVMFAPALLIYAIIRGKTMQIIRNKNFVIGIAVFFVFGIGYYFLRELFNPGYIRAVWDNELGGRYLHPLEGHDEPFWFYYHLIIEDHFQYWYLLVPCGVLAGIASRNKCINNLTIFISIAIVQFFLVISWGQTKIGWYDAPLFPLLALLGAIFISTIIDIFKGSEIFKKNLKYDVLTPILLFLLFIKPYCSIIDYVYQSKEESYYAWLTNIPNYMKRVLDNKENINGYKIVFTDGPGAIIFYQHLLANKGQQVFLVTLEDLKANDRVIVSQDEVASQVEQKFNVEMLKNENGLRTYRIVSKK